MDDLRAIETEMSAIGTIEVASDEFEGTGGSVDDFAALGVKSLRSLEIKALGRHERTLLTLTGDQDNVRIYSWASENRAVAGVLARLERICEARRRRVVQALSRLYLLTLPLATAVAAASAQTDPKNTGLQWLLLAIFIGLVLLAGIGVVVSRLCRGAILLVPRSERPGWFRRNRDDLVVQTIAGVVVLGVGILIGRLIK